MRRKVSRAHPTKLACESASLGLQAHQLAAVQKSPNTSSHAVAMQSQINQNQGSWMHTLYTP